MPESDNYQEWLKWQNTWSKKAEIKANLAENGEANYQGLVMARWGSKAWPVSVNKLMPLSDLQTSIKITEEFTEAKDNKPSTVKTTRNLIPLTLTSQLVRSGDINVRDQIEIWSRKIEETHYLEIGGKPFGPPYKLKEVNVSDVQMAPNGAMLAARLDLVFDEDLYYDLTVLTPEQLKDAPVKYFKVGSTVKIVDEAKQCAPAPSTDAAAATGKKISVKNITTDMKSRKYTIVEVDNKSDPDKVVRVRIRSFTNFTDVWVYVKDLTLVIE